MTLPTSLAACSRICMRGDRAARERVAPTRSPHSRPNSACRTRRFGARSRGTSSGASSAARVGSFRQTQWTSGRLRRTCIPRGPVGVRSAPCRSQSGRSLALNSLRRESSGTPRSSRALAMSVEKIMRASGDVVWRVRWAAARQEPCANLQHSPRRPRLRRGGPSPTPGRKPPRARRWRRDFRRIRD